MNKKSPLPLAAFLGSDGSGGSGNCAASGSSNVTATAAAAAAAAANGSGGRVGGRQSSSVGGASVGGASKSDKREAGGGGGSLCGCQKAPKSHCISATGEKKSLKKFKIYGRYQYILYPKKYATFYKRSCRKHYISNVHLINKFTIIFSLRTVDRLWMITEDLNILYKENWTRLAAQEVQLFQDTLLRAVRQSKVYPPGGIQLNAPTHKWTYASAFLYSLTLITTIGE
ncbi:hypothetical protein KR084_006451 [Drosophila pseudotakahashii]|nr:hypothetical protein KR084_006451 [Drosophila pseudotakahashii]